MAAPVAAPPPLPDDDELLPEEYLIVTPPSEPELEASLSDFLAADDEELDEDFPEDDRLPARPASLAPEKAISSAAIRVYVPVLVFMGSPLVFFSGRRLAGTGGRFKPLCRDCCVDVASILPHVYRQFSGAGGKLGY
jgi:hypothetical protein